MSVTLEPTELGFRRPFTQEVTQLLRIKNSSKDPIAFKVKTTAPKQYCVRPNSGRIEVAGEVEVQVLLQAMKEDPPPDARCRDKFLVQSVAITPERDLGNITAIWQNVEKNAKTAVEERKIRVLFLSAEGTAATPQHNNVNGTYAGSDAPPAYGSPAFGSPGPEAVTPQTHHTAADTRGPQNSATVTEKVASAASTASTATVNAASNVANAVPKSTEDLKAELAAAKDQITRLRSQAEESTLRQRKTDTASQGSREKAPAGATGINVQEQSADGVPVQIVAALCLLSFLLAYFFF